MKAVKRAAVILVVIILAAGVYIFGFRNDGADSGAAATLYVADETGIAVEAFRAGYDQLVPRIQSSGIIRGRNEAVIVSETRGLIEDVYVKIGDYVEKGDPVLRVDGRSAEAAMNQAFQQLNSADIDLRAVERAYRSGGASESELLTAQGRAAGAKAAYLDASERFENTTVKAPVSGFLADMENGLSSGNYITEGVRIGRVIDLTGIRLTLFLGGNEIRRIAVGSSALIVTGDASIKGSVTAIALTSDAATGSFKVIVEADNEGSEDLRSGYTADVFIEGTEERTEIIIPASALVDAGGDYVFVSENTRARLRPVRLGRRSGSRVEVLEGLDEGELVVLTGLKSLSEGAQLVPSLVSAEGVDR